MSPDTEYKFSKVGGALPLDFVNTISTLVPEERNEHLHSYADLLRWARDVGALEEAEIIELGRRALSHPDEAETVFRDAISLRRAIYRIFLAASMGEEPPRDAMNTLNGLLSRAHSSLVVEKEREGFGWVWAGPKDALDRVLWPVAHEAAHLLIEGDLTRIRQCAGDTCGWLFLDASKNRRRRWCDMSNCGNRAKARRYYRKQASHEAHS
jgi:predicted RNA-binding Zn ribbon-like protein